MIVSKLTRIQTIGWLGLLVLLTTSVQAQLSAGLTTDFRDSRTLKVQRKVEQLFERGEYERAYFIYVNELVPIGDKYAQYMVGFMHLTGKGVAEDPIIASAWYRLAAERGTPQFKAVRDMLLDDLSAEQRLQSDRAFLEIRRRFSDLVILLGSIKRSLSDIQPVTGSRLTGSRLNSGGALVVVEVQPSGRSQSSSLHYRRGESELEKNLEMLARIGGFTDLDTDPSRLDIDEVERLVNEHLESISD